MANSRQPYPHPQPSHFFRSVGYAWRGVRDAVKSEANFRRQLLAALVAVVLTIIFRLPAWQVMVVILVIAVVLMAELFNSALEALADAVRPEHNEVVRQAKDVASAAVLIISLGALVIGLMLFGPPVVAWLT